MPEKDHRTIGDLLREIPDEILYLFATECIKNFALEEDLGEEVIKEAYRTARFVQTMVWGIIDANNYKINVPSQYAQLLESPRSSVTSSLPPKDQKRIRLYVLMNDCLKMVDEIKNRKTNHAVSIAASIARGIKSLGEDGGLGQDRWQHQRLEKMKRWIIPFDTDQLVVLKWFSSYIEAVAWEWGARGLGIQEDMLNVLAAMRSEKINGDTVNKIKKHLSKHAKIATVHTDNPDATFNVFVAGLTIMWGATLIDKQQRDFSFRYLEEWLGKEATDRLENRIIASISQIEDRVALKKETVTASEGLL